MASCHPGVFLFLWNSFGSYWPEVQPRCRCPPVPVRSLVNQQPKRGVIWRFMEVSEEVAEIFKEFDRKEAAYRLRTYRHKAYYSLDRDDGLEHEAVFVSLSPHELYERKISMQELHAAISSLPDKQAKRIYAHFILGMTKKDIARAEGVDEKVVRVAIERGLKNLEKYLKKFL